MNINSPRGVRTIAFANIIFFGLFTVLASLFILFSPHGLDQLINLFSRDDLVLKNISLNQMRVIVLAQVFVGILYFISGLGLLLGRENGRRFTVYFAFLLILLVLFSALMRPGAVSQSLLNAFYPGIMVFYLTNKNVEQWFRERAKSTNEK